MQCVFRDCVTKSGRVYDLMSSQALRKDSFKEYEEVAGWAMGVALFCRCRREVFAITDSQTWLDMQGQILWGISIAHA